MKNSPKPATVTQLRPKLSIAEDQFEGIPHDDILAKAEQICFQRLRTPGVHLSSPKAVKEFLRLKLGHLEHESFTVLFGDVRSRLIECVEVSRGTVTTAHVYPREICKLALKHNAVSVILAHNHPSGIAEPSPADKALTAALVKTLKLIDVDVHDHIIIAGMESFSFAEMGQMPS